MMLHREADGVNNKRVSRTERQGDGDVVIYHICNTKMRSHANEQDNRTLPLSSGLNSHHANVVA